MVLGKKGGNMAKPVNNVGAANTYNPYVSPQRGAEKPPAKPQPETPRDEIQIQPQPPNKPPETPANADIYTAGTNNAPAQKAQPPENAAAAANQADLQEVNHPENPQNPAAPENRIRDTNVAYESANAVKDQITTQPGVAMLAQANANPAMVVNLLK